MLLPPWNYRENGWKVKKIPAHTSRNKAPWLRLVKCIFTHQWQRWLADVILQVHLILKQTHINFCIWFDCLWWQPVKCFNSFTTVLQSCIQFWWHVHLHLKTPSEDEFMLCKTAMQGDAQCLWEGSWIIWWQPVTHHGSHLGQEPWAQSCYRQREQELAKLCAHLTHGGREPK